MLAQLVQQVHRVRQVQAVLDQVVTAIEFTSPVWVALLAAMILGERLTPPRWTAIAGGIAGIPQAFSAFPLASPSGVTGPLPAGAVTLPAVIDTRYWLRLLTRIDVYGGIVLADYACSLNVPRFLPGKPVFNRAVGLKDSWGKAS